MKDERNPQTGVGEFSQRRGPLFFAGLISLFELRRVSSDTEEILRASERNLGLAKDMLDAAARQNKAVVHSIVFRQRDYDTVLMGSIA